MHRIRPPKGQILVVIAAVLVVLIGVMALCGDLGVMYFTWSALQKAADASALAGANYLPNNVSKANSTAASYAQLNGAAPSEIVTNQIGNSNTTITVGLQRTVPYYFARVLGLVNAPINVQATAGVQNVGSASGFLPVGLPCNQQPPVGNCGYTQGNRYTLKGGMVTPGNWEPLALGGSGGANLRTNLDYGYNGPDVSIGQNVSTQPGLDVGNTKAGLDDRMSRTQYPSNGPPPATFDSTDSRVALVPMVDFTGTNGTSVAVPVRGFAVMWISSVDGKGTITAYFVTAVAGKPDPGSNGANSGALAVLLLK